MEALMKYNYLLTIKNKKMQYKVEQIGAEFSAKGMTDLESRFNNRADTGFKFHSVFQVQKPGCMGIGSPTTTYLAVFVQE